LRAERFNGDIHPLAFGHAPDFFDRICLGVVDNYVSAHALRHSGAHGIRFHGDDEAGTP
jgi:hypothetical protein